MERSPLVEGGGFLTDREWLDIRAPLFDVAESVGVASSSEPTWTKAQLVKASAAKPRIRASLATILAAKDVGPPGCRKGGEWR